MLKDVLKSLSPMPFEKFMEVCLFHPEYGYYSKGNLPGKSGDYITSPCVHKVFGATIAIQVLEIYELLGKPNNFVIVEAGAGQGYLALDILSYLSEKGYKFNYYIIEPLKSIKSIQEQTLALFSSQVKWFNSLEELPCFIGIFISNELFDCFPVHLVEKRNSSLKEIWVEVDDSGEIKEVLRDLSNSKILEIITPFFKKWINGYRTEVCLKTFDFYEVLCKKLEAGAILTIDYGYPRRDYYSPERTKGTLLCYYKHKVIESPYLKPGDTDITAHVDFTSLKEAGEKHGLKTFGFTQQGSYLVGLGIERILVEVSEKNWRDIEALKFLVFPQGLGSSHWVLLQGKIPDLKEDYQFKGFSLSNKVYLL
ncbi:MAG: SAM-dependent methyltransferase [Thermodesulfobacteria bacterium]|nr:SAM-dependent methyltransferase [Thermodesulfobacteriota bacterium]